MGCTQGQAAGPIRVQVVALTPDPVAAFIQGQVVALTPDPAVAFTRGQVVGLTPARAAELIRAQVVELTPVLGAVATVALAAVVQTGGIVHRPIATEEGSSTEADIRRPARVAPHTQEYLCPP